MAEPKLGASGTLGQDQMKQLRAIAEKITPLLEQRDEVNEEISAAFKEAGEAGFDTKIVRKAISTIRKGPAGRAEQEMVDLYTHAIQPDLFKDAA